MVSFLVIFKSMLEIRILRVQGKNFSRLLQLPSGLRRSQPLLSLNSRKFVTMSSLEEKQNKLFQDTKIDILSSSYEEDNAKARAEVSRSFVCESAFAV